MAEARISAGSGKAGVSVGSTRSGRPSANRARQMSGVSAQQARPVGRMVSRKLQCTAHQERDLAVAERAGNVVGFRAGAGLVEAPAHACAVVDLSARRRRGAEHRDVHDVLPAIVLDGRCAGTCRA